MMAWFQRVFLRRRLYDDLAEELHQHIEEKTEQFMRLENLPRREAERAARRAFGNLALTEERSREVWQWPTLESIWADVRYAVRQLRKTPSFVVIAILTLTLAVGANTAVFSLLDALLLRSLPVRNPQELVLFRHDFGSWPAGGFNSTGWDDFEFSYPLFERFRQEQPKIFSDVFGYASLGFKDKNVVLRCGAHTMEATGTMVTGSFFQGLGVTPVLGRTINESDVSSAAPGVAVISYGLWQRAFAGSPSVIGQSITLNNISYTIVGVASPEFTGVQPGISDDLWIPVTDKKALAPWGGGLQQSPTTSEKWWWLSVIGRLRPGITREQAAAALSPQLVATLRTLKGSAPPAGKLPFIKLDEGNRGMPFMEEMYGQPVKLLMCLVLLVLLAACANLATLLLARARARSREIAVRLAIGASRARVWRQLLTESVLISIIGGALGIVVAPIAMRATGSGLSQDSNQFSVDLVLDYRVLLFTAVLCILTGLLFGIAPALRSGRIDVTSTLKEDAACRSIRSSVSMRSLVVAQAAISTFLLIVCGIFLHSLTLLYSQRTGFDTRHLLIFHLEPTQSGYSIAQLPELYARIQQRLDVLPGVRGVTTMGSRFMSGWKNQFDVEIEGFEAPDRRKPNVLNDDVGPRFLATAGIPLLQGRDFAESDTATSEKVAIINESLAKKYFNGRNPIGMHITFKPWDGDKPIQYAIVGICQDSLYYSLRSEPKPTWYQAMTQEPDDRLKSVNFMLRTEGNPAALASSAIAALHEIDPRLVADDVRTQSEQIDTSLGSERMFAEASAFFGGLALLLATIGLYGTLAYSVVRRRREIGIRLALGAQRKTLLQMVLRQGLALVLLGVSIGWGASALVGRLLASMITDVVFRVHTFDVLSFLGSAALLIALSATAALIPARRAASTDPLVALRTD